MDYIGGFTRIYFSLADSLADSFQLPQSALLVQVVLGSIKVSPCPLSTQSACYILLCLKAQIHCSTVS